MGPSDVNSAALDGLRRINSQPRRWARIGAPRYVALALAAVLKNIPPWTPPRRR
jgi:hypothetical protein